MQPIYLTGNRTGSQRDFVTFACRKQVGCLQWAFIAAVIHCHELRGRLKTTKGHYLTGVQFRSLTQVFLGCCHSVTGCSFWRVQERPVLFELLETTRIPWFVISPPSSQQHNISLTLLLFIPITVLPLTLLLDFPLPLLRNIVIPLSLPLKSKIISLLSGQLLNNLTFFFAM